MPRNYDPKTRENLTRWLSQFAPSAGKLGDVERYWKSRWHELTRCEPDYDIHYTINNYTNGLADEYTAVFVVDHDGERLAVYGYDGSYPYTMNEDDWVERIDGNRLPKREPHVVIEVYGSDYPAGRCYTGDTLDEAIETFIDNFLDSEDGENFNAQYRYGAIQHIRDLYPDGRAEFDGSALGIAVYTCTCAGHTYTAHYE